MADYPDDTYTDEEEWQDNVTEEQRDMWEEASGTLPSKKSQTLFSLFKDVWKTTDSSKVSNLDKEELGTPELSVRDCQRIALFSETFHHPNFAKVFDEQAEITLATSMSKKGWFVELFVTTKKFAHKGNVSNLGLGTERGKQKWRIFGKPTQEMRESTAE